MTMFWFRNIYLHLITSRSRIHVGSFSGFVNQLLSWEAFQPLSRVSYIMYLVHITIFQILGMAMTFEITYSHFTAVVYFLSATVMVVVVSGIVFVGVELPWLTLEKLLVGKLLSLTKRS